MTMSWQEYAVLTSSALPGIAGKQGQRGGNSARDDRRRGYSAAVKCEHGPDEDESLAVSLGTPGNGTWARLWNRADPWGDGSIKACAQIGAPGLLATVHGVTLAVMGGSDLAPFLDGLARDFTGWNGTRAWANMDGDLRIDAVFNSRGYVGLTWTITPWRHEDGNWTASMTVVLEAGEQTRHLAADVHQFLQRLVGDHG